MPESIAADKNGVTLKPLTERRFRELEAKDKYYKGRWEYYATVTDIVRRLKPPATSCLEIGAYRLPVLLGSDTMDIKDHLGETTYVHDAGVAPWPIPDKKYDLAIALQIWEHLEGRQVQAFSELRRIANRAVMSFPLGWDRPGNATHHAISEDMILEWVHNLKPVHRHIVGSRSSPRLIYVLNLK
jgi:hypothetical protein